jgi:hypothetical protein
MPGQPHPSTIAPPHGVDAPLRAIEGAMAELDAAFASGEMTRVDQAAVALQRSLADALAAFRHAARTGAQPLSPELQRRLQLAQARIQAQQASVVRAQASIERTLGVLLPREEGSTYGTGYGAVAATPQARLAQAYR